VGVAAVAVGVVINKVGVVAEVVDEEAIGAVTVIGQRKKMGLAKQKDPMRFLLERRGRGLWNRMVGLMSVSEGIMPRLFLNGLHRRKQNWMKPSRSCSHQEDTGNQIGCIMLRRLSISLLD
jgi:hypothetical protein